MTASPPPSLPASTSALPDADLGSGAGAGVSPSVALSDAPPIPPPAVQWGVPDAVQHPEATSTALLRALPRSKSRAGRRPGAVWTYFTPVRTEQNKTHAVCRFCARRCAGVAARMASHLRNKCPAVPAHERDALTAALAHDTPLPPPEKRQRVAADTPFNAASASDTRDDPTLAAALPLVAVACLRTQAPLALVDDAFFRDAVALLRPQSLGAIHAINAATLRANVGASVVRTNAHWTRQSESFTLVYSGTAHEWRGADSSRHAMLLDDASEFCRTQLQTHVQAIGHNAIVGFCSDVRDVYDHVRRERIVTDSPLHRIQLVSQCLLTATVRLWACVVDATPQLATGMIGAADITQTATAAGTSEDVALRTQGLLVTGTAADWSLPFRAVKRLNAKEASFELLETEAEPEATASATRAAFWNDLPAVDALLAPFAWLFVVNESTSVCASQVVLCWLWLLATLEQSPLMTEEDKRMALVETVLSVMLQTMEDHHLVALLLDPRTHGAGLSATGRRKVKTLVVNVATRLWPTTFESSPLSETLPMPTPARQALLSQLSEYLDKTGCFADEVVWEMAHGAVSPEKFWRDYAQDAPQLAALAMAVLTSVPVASQTSEWMMGAKDGTKIEPFDARQIRFHYERNRANGEYDMATVLTKYAELVVPGGGAGGGRTALSAPPLRPLPPVSLASASVTQPPLALVDATKAELQRLGSVEAHHRSDAESSAAVANMDATWLAFHSDADRHAIDAARLCLLPTALLASASASTPASAVSLSPSPSTVSLEV